jgi:hypothetical protein
MKLMKKMSIEKQLTEALLQDGNMAYALYEYDMEEYVDDWHQSLLEDKYEFLFAVNENSDDVAMVLILPDKSVYINEKAREKLQAIWRQAYEGNIKHLIPIMATELANDSIAVNGVSSIASQEK